MPRGPNWSISFPDGTDEEQIYFSKLPNRSNWVLERVRGEMKMDKEKIERRIRELEEELTEQKELLEFLKNKESQKAHIEEAVIGKRIHMQEEEENSLMEGHIDIARGLAKEGNKNGARRYIDAYIKSGKLTEEQAKEILGV
jgi:hypothetical protein